MAEQEIYNTLYEFDPVAVRWRAPSVAGTAPSPRTGHSMSVAPTFPGTEKEAKVYLFGGSSPDEGPINDVFILTARLTPSSDSATVSYSWEQIGTRGKAPAPREMHAALVLPPAESAASERDSSGTVASSAGSAGHLVIVGGRNEDGKPQLDAAILDLDSRQWLPALRIARPVVAAAVGTSHGNRVAYMFGGWSGATTLSASLLRLDMRRQAAGGSCDPSQWSWTVMDVTPAPAPLPRFAAAGCFVAGPAVVSGTAARADAGAGADSPPSSDHADSLAGRLFVFGGMHYERDFAELLEFRLK